MSSVVVSLPVFVRAFDQTSSHSRALNVKPIGAPLFFCSVFAACLCGLVLPVGVLPCLCVPVLPLALACLLLLFLVLCEFEV